MYGVFKYLIDCEGSYQVVARRSRERMVDLLVSEIQEQRG